MAYSKVERHIWNDEKFRRWPRDTRDVWIYLLTGEHQNRLGFFVLPLATIAEDTQITPESARESLELLDAQGRIMWDPDTRLILILRHLKHNTPENPNVAKGAASETLSKPFGERFGKRLWEGLLEAVEKYCPMETVRRTPFCSILHAAVLKRLAEAEINPFETVTQTPSKPFGKPFRNPEPEPEPEPEHEPEPEPDPTAVVAGREVRPTAPTIESTTDGPTTAASDPIEEAASHIIQRANEGQVANPHIDQQRFRPILTSHGSRSTVIEWLRDGIPGKLILETVYDRASNFEPIERRPQITTMRYFDAAVRDEHDRRTVLPQPGSQARAILDAGPKAEKPQSRAERAGNPDDEAERQRELQETRTIHRWVRDNREAAEKIRADVVKEVHREFGSLGADTIARLIEGRTRSKVLAMRTRAAKS